MENEWKPPCVVCQEHEHLQGCPASQEQKADGTWQYPVTNCYRCGQPYIPREAYDTICGDCHSLAAITVAGLRM